MKNYLLAILFLFPFSVMAQETAPVPNPPDLPPPVESGESLEPDVTIIQRDKETLYEYRVNGQLYKVKVKPVVGPEYYFVDTDGDGELERFDDDPTNITVPQWVLFRF